MISVSEVSYEIEEQSLNRARDHEHDEGRGSTMANSWRMRTGVQISVQNPVRSTVHEYSPESRVQVLH